MVILIGMTGRVGPKGQVVIPKPMRDRLGLRPGDEVTFWLEGDAVRLEPVRRDSALRGRFRGRQLIDDLEGEHQRELEGEHDR